MEIKILEERTKTEPFLKYCRAEYWPKPNFVMCLVSPLSCDYAKSFGFSSICEHPLKYDICRRTIAKYDKQR